MRSTWATGLVVAVALLGARSAGAQGVCTELTLYGDLSTSWCGVTRSDGTLLVEDLNGIPGIDCPGTNCDGNTYTVSDWADPIRVVLAGMHHDDGDDIGRQDCNSDVRWSLVETWENLFGRDCNSTCDKVHHLWRLPDDDAATATFLELLGLPPIEAEPFCNGDELEDNDPIRRPCNEGDPYRAAEDVCQPSGTLGLVLPIVPGPGSTEPCSLGVFRWKILPFTRFECPQGISPLFGLCLQPQDAQGNFGCLNPPFNTSFGTPAGVDGRVHNLWPLNADGTAPIVNGKELVAAFDRIHSGCRAPSASDRVECLTRVDRCTLGTACNAIEPHRFPCDEQGIRDAIAAGGGPHTFDCPLGGKVIETSSTIYINYDVILDGQMRLTLDTLGNNHLLYVRTGVEAHLARMTLRSSSVKPRTDYGCINGGCIFNQGTLELGSVNLINCVACGSGGAIDSWGTVELTGSYVGRNEASRGYGGGIYNHGSLTVRETTFVGNKAGGPHGGGAIASGGYTDASGTDHFATLRVIDSTLIGNDVVDEDGSPIGAGGAIRSWKGHTELINTTVTGNSASGGGAIQTTGDLTLAASTVAWNETGSPNSADIEVSGDDAFFAVHNSVIVGDDCDVAAASAVYVSYDVESPGNTCGFEGRPGCHVQITEDAVGLWGRYTPNCHLTVGCYIPPPNSFLLEKIPEPYCWTDADQRTVPRPQYGACDIGAVERSPSDPP